MGLRSSGTVRTRRGISRRGEDGCHSGAQRRHHQHRLFRGTQAKIGRCRTTARDTAVQTHASTVRYPDVVVDCGPVDQEGTVAESPTLIVEVSSPGTASVDTTDKFDEYQGHPAVRLIMVVEPSIVSVKLYRRNEDGVWSPERYDALDGVIDMPEIHSVLTLAEIYDTLLPRLLHACT
ncbi:Uma2 family endonuclease [Aurantimonas litoralis]|nr:Uma2 family endonuclease [Aurantimonas litoralis]